jgi:hypothetical protein
MPFVHFSENRFALMEVRDEGGHSNSEFDGVVAGYEVDDERSVSAA